MTAERVKTPKGVCIINEIQPEFTICGDAFDLASDEPGYEWKATRSRTVTCPDCAAIVMSVRGVRVA